MDEQVDEKYEVLCAEFQYAWVRLLKDVLTRNGVAAAEAKKICGEFSFDFSMLFDQGELDCEGAVYRPFVAFTDDGDDEGGHATMFVEPNGPHFHDYAFGTTAHVFEEG